MATTIAICGKGGTGKTTISAMVIRTLMDRSAKAVLAVDADPNSCLGLALGVDSIGTIAEVRDQSRERPPSNAGMDRMRTFEYGIQQALTEAKGFDLLTMGQPEGPACYCAANNLLRQFLDKLSSQYSFVLVDNEAGMEHLSRRTTNNIDLLCIVAEATAVGALTAERISKLTKHLPIIVKRVGLLWNKSESCNSVAGIENLGCVPYDEEVFEASVQSKTVFDLEETNPALLAVGQALEQGLESVLAADK